MRSLISCLLTLGLLGGLAQGSDVSPLRYSHPDAKVLLGINFRKLQTQSWAASLRSELEKSALPTAPDAELLNGIDHIFLSVVPEAGKVQAGKGRKSDARMLITLKGRFNLALWRAFAVKQGATLRPYGSVELVQPPARSAEEVHAALLNAETIVLGDRASLLAALDRSPAEAAASEANHLFQRAAGYAGRYDLWAVATVPLPGALTSQLPATAVMLQDIQGLGLGLSLDKSLLLDVDLDTTSASSAQSLANVLSMMVAMSATAKPGQGAPGVPAMDFLKRTTVQAKGVQVKLHLEAGMEELAQRFAPLQGMLAMGQGMKARAVVRSRTSEGTREAVGKLAPLPGAREATPEILPPPPPKKIRIINADDGVREILLQ